MGAACRVLAFPPMNAHDNPSFELYQEAIETLRRLLDEAAQSGEPEPTAMNLATQSADGRISNRIVLLKGLDVNGLQFFSNYESAKARQLSAHNQASVCFHWKHLRNQVQARVEGRVSKMTAAESDAYFATRPRMSQIGAWASQQSQELPSRDVFDARVEEFEQRFAAGDVPRPPHWGGYRLRPELFEFWHGAGFRLHDRQQYVLHDGVWSKRLLYP